MNEFIQNIIGIGHIFKNCDQLLLPVSYFVTG